MTNDLKLIKRYEPVLKFSKDGADKPENFFPLAAKHYVHECGLRRRGQGWLHQPGKTLLKHLAQVQKSEQCYLAYAAGDLSDVDILRLGLDHSDVQVLSELLDQGLLLTRVGDTVSPRLVVSSEKADILKERLSRSAWGKVVDRQPLAKEASEWLGASGVATPEANLGMSLPPELLGVEPDALADHLATEIPAIREVDSVTLGERGFASLPESILERAKEKYKLYRDWDKYPPVYHYHVCKDRRENGGYRVLQYWFLYAYNDWTNHSGLNDHEGDWEMICVFLNDKNKAQWVAYSRHIKFLHYPGLDKEPWTGNRLQKDSTHPIVYVGCGSHANYLNKGSDNLLLWRDYHEGNDVAIGPGTTYPWGKPIRLGGKPWNIKFGGNWGALVKKWMGWVVQGTEGPPGPAHQGKKWYRPAEWADIHP